MCGFAGIFAYSNNAPPVLDAELLRMRDQMLHRGPDGEGLWISADKRVGLGHRRLSIIDLSDNGSQPMASLDGRYQIIFNGEIYNFKELRSELQAQGFIFRGHSDTEVLLALYAQKGEAMCSLLRGMYAFAIWDNLTQSLFLARDPFGMKPLYWHDDGKTIRFASQVKALLAGGGIKTESEPAGVVGYWIWGSVPEPFTLYKDLLSLEPGTWLRIERDGKRESGSFQSLFDLFSKSSSVTSSYSSLREALLDSVQAHLVSDVPVGIFLSAGIDPSTILGLALECGTPLKSVTLGFKEFQGTSSDETVLAELVAKKYGFKHETLWITQQDFEDKLEHFMSSMDQPTIDGLNTYLVADAATQCGLKVALSGLGADEFFGGYPSFNHIPKIHRLGHVLAKTPFLAKLTRQISAPVFRKFTSEKYAGLLEYGSSWEGAYLLRRASRMPWMLGVIDGLDSLTIKAGLESLAKNQLKDTQLNDLGESFGVISHLESTRYMRNQLLRDSDWAGMSHSLEIRLPFLDWSLIEYIAYQRNQGITMQKIDIFNMLGPSLPNEILNRPKTGFETPIKSWIKNNNLKPSKSHGLHGWQEVVFNFKSNSIVV